ncbi:MAG: hypothetical protein IBX72_01030 [Nitrospirae bacterium]|nr:hypothetical protein [Nitrospirota bacterium]
MKKKQILGLALFAVLFILFTGSIGSADPRMRFQDINWAFPSSSDYAPSILWDGSQWVMYQCGWNADGEGKDKIYRWVSSNGIDWTRNPLKAILAPTAGSWDSLFVCDPSVLYGVNIQGYPWALWYTGTSDPSGCSNDIGLALSADGIDWVKYGKVVDCPIVPNYYGCGEQSVVKVGSTYYMHHTEILGSGTNQWGARVRTSTNGINWSSGTFYIPPGITPGTDFGVDFMYSSGIWYSVMHTGFTKLGIYSSTTIQGTKTLLGELSISEARKSLSDPIYQYLLEPAFWRDGLGHQLSESPDIWVAYGIGNGFPGPWDIEAAKFAIMDAEQNTVDPWFGARACEAPGVSIIGPYYAWHSNGPKGDDINYWDFKADGDGVDEACTIALRGFLNPDFSSGTKLEITWYGWVTGGTTGNPKVEVWLQNGPYYYFLGHLSGLGNTKYKTTFEMGSVPRSYVQAINFRIKESYFTNLYQSGATMRTHLFKVRLAN